MCDSAVHLIERTQFYIIYIKPTRETLAYENCWDATGWCRHICCMR